jgi:hypothetical protein
MLFVVESDICRIESKEMSELVWHISAYLFISAIFEPNLK